MWNRREHESKRLRLVGGLFVLSDKMGYVFSDVDVSDNVSATTTPESIAKTVKKVPRTEH